MHHERRLHKLMLADELRQYERDGGAAATGGLSTVPSVGSRMEDMSLEGDSDQSVAAGDNFADPSQVRRCEERLPAACTCPQSPHVLPMGACATYALLLAAD